MASPFRWARRSALTASVLLLVAAAPSGARAEWSAPFDLSLPGTSMQDPQVAVAPSGAAVATWVSYAGSDATAQARRIAADGTLGPILNLSQPGRRADDPDVAIDAAGNAIVVWSDRGQTGTEEIVRARRITATGALEPTVDITSAGLSSALPKVAVTPAGAATVVWFRRPGTVHLRRIDPVGGPGATLDVSPPDSSQFDLAVDANGDAHIVWATFDGTNQLIHTRRADAGGALTPTITLSDGDQLSFAPQIALDATGNPTVTWVREDDGIELRRGTAGGGLGLTVTVAPAGALTGDRDLAVDGAGNATVVWRGQSGSNQAVFLRRVPASGPPGPINDLWSGGEDGDPRLASDGAGIPTVIWSHHSGAGATIRARTAPVSAPLGAIAALWPASTDTLVDDPRIASNAEGDVTAVWKREGGAGEAAIAAARFTVASPTPPPPAGDPPAPQLDSPAPAPSPTAPPSCATVAVKRLSGHTGRQPKTKRAKGTAARLTLDRGAQLDLISASLTYRHAGKARTAKLRTHDITAGRRAILRFKLPARLVPRLDLGHRVRLELKLRARSTGNGCPYGTTHKRTVRTKVIWVTRRTAS
jgi:hypothetical protein